MPKIFNPEDRAIIREKLMKLGLEALEQGGYKSASIEAITRQAGIAKGTFYNFYKSKEHFYFEIMLSLRDAARRELYDFVAPKSAIAHQQLEDFLYERYANRKNIYHYFTTDEFKIIFRKMPDQLLATNDNSVSLVTQLLASIPNASPHANHEVVVNMLNIMGSYAADKGLLSIGSKQQTLRLMAHSLAGYILDKECDQ